SGVARIPQDADRRCAQSKPTVGGAQKQHPAVAAHRAARKIDLHRALATSWKAETPLGTICHRQDPPMDSALTQRNLSIIRSLAVPCSARAMNDPGYNTGAQNSPRRLAPSRRVRFRDREFADSSLEGSCVDALRGLRALLASDGHAGCRFV